MRIPKKPFANYKWRWAVYTPTETLNEPPIFLGILRVLRNDEYKRFSSIEVKSSQPTPQSISITKIAIAAAIQGVSTEITIA